MAMEIKITSTDKITEIDGVPVRHWEGVTAAGVKCHVFVHRIAVHEDEDFHQFQDELREMDPPGGPQRVPLSAIL